MAAKDENWYCLASPDSIDSPALLFYPDRVKGNIALIIKMLNGAEQLRPHIKTCKAKEPVLLLMLAGIRKFKCATISEAQMIAECSAEDVLIAYQLNKTKLCRFVQLIKAYPGTKFSCLVDNKKTASLISKIAVENNLSFRVWIDLNTGMNRTGILAGAEAIDLYEYVTSLPSIIYCGFHAYDGHIHERNYEKRHKIIDNCFQSVEDLRATLASKGKPFPWLVAGGTPTFTNHAQRRQTEVSPGTFIFWDRGYHDAIPEQNFSYAALVLTRIISLPTADTLCIDLGHKAIASENEIGSRVSFLNAPDLYPISHSEEHMVVYAGRDHSYSVGDILYALPFHICPTVALYEKGICIKDGIPEGTWPIIARDRMITI